MPTASDQLVRSITEDYARLYPHEVADILDDYQAKDAAGVLEQMSDERATAVFQKLSPATSTELLPRIDGERARVLVRSLDPPRAGALLAGLDKKFRESLLQGFGETEARELRGLMQYPPDCAGRLMDSRIDTFRPDTSVEQAVERLRGLPANKRIFNLFVVDAAGRLAGAIPLQVAALAAKGKRLGELLAGPPAAVSALDPRDEIVKTMNQHKLAGIPVVDSDGKPIGVIRLDELVTAVEQEASADLLSMVGVGREERALSHPSFAVRKRLPWLQINLATAFLAASVVGLFEDTIARFTALAVLLPVVAGQSGNTGAQALAVVLRSLALREITLRHWPKVAAKEFATGLLNGLAVSFTTCIGVYIWSGSLGLVGVIGIAMVISMVIAGVAGAVIPVVLSAMGQDPAQSSSIILTTVTDVFGFFSFLGLATAFSSML